MRGGQIQLEKKKDGLLSTRVENIEGPLKNVVFHINSENNISGFRGHEESGSAIDFSGKCYFDKNLEKVVQNTQVLGIESPIYTENKKRYFKIEEKVWEIVDSRSTPQGREFDIVSVDGLVQTIRNNDLIKDGQGSDWNILVDDDSIRLKKMIIKGENDIYVGGEIERIPFSDSYIVCHGLDDRYTTRSFILPVPSYGYYDLDGEYVEKDEPAIQISSGFVDGINGYALSFGYVKEGGEIDWADDYIMLRPDGKKILFRDYDDQHATYFFREVDNQEDRIVVKNKKTGEILDKWIEWEMDEKTGLFDIRFNEDTGLGRETNITIYSFQEVRWAPRFEFSRDIKDFNFDSEVLVGEHNLKFANIRIDEIADEHIIFDILKEDGQTQETGVLLRVGETLPIEQEGLYVDNEYSITLRSTGGAGTSARINLKNEGYRGFSCIGGEHYINDRLAWLADEKHITEGGSRIEGTMYNGYLPSFFFSANQGLFSYEIVREDEMVSVEDHKFKDGYTHIYDFEFLVYPNPANGLSTIEFELNKEQEVSYDLTDLQGNVLKKETEILPQGVNKIDVGTEDLASGQYYLTLTINGFAKTQRLVISK